MGTSCQRMKNYCLRITTSITTLLRERVVSNLGGGDIVITMVIEANYYGNW